LHSKIKPLKLESEFCGLQHIFNSSAKGLKMLAVCSIKTSKISNPDTQGSIPKISFHLLVSVKQTPNEGKQIKNMMQLKLRIPHKKECYCYYIYSLISFLYLMYFSSLMTTYVTFSVQVMETYLQRTSSMKLYLLHFHTEYKKKLSISVTKTTTKSVTYILLTTYLLN